MRRVLIITYYWPPTGGSGVQRWLKFAKYLPSQGWQPVVYTPSNPEQLAVDESLVAEIPPEAEVIKRPIAEPYAVYHKLTGRKEQKGAGLNPINAQKKTFKQRLMLWIRSNFFVPDPRAGWVRPSVRFLKEYLREHPVDVIVTTGPPHSVHLIGRGLHRALGVPWIADFRDPWTRMYYFGNLPMLPWVKRRHFRLEKTVLDEASAVIAVTPFVAEDFRSMGSAPVELITNGYDEDDFAAVLPPRKDGAFRIVHTGLFASDGNPLALWKALSGLCSRSKDFASRLEIRLAGKVDPEIVEAVQTAGLGANLRLLGYLSHPDSVAELRQADVILMPLRDSAEYSKAYPGKIFECIAAAHPTAKSKGPGEDPRGAIHPGIAFPKADAAPVVLGIGPSDSAAAQLLRETGAGDMVGWNDDPTGFIEAAFDGAASTSLSSRDTASFSRRALTEQLVALLCRVAD